MRSNHTDVPTNGSIKGAILRFQDLHESYKRGDLARDTERAYLALRESIYAALVVTQGLDRMPGQTARQAARVAIAARIRLSTGDAPQTTVTCDVSVGGFAALVKDVLPVGGRCVFVLTTAGRSLVGEARVVACHRQGAAYRASFEIETMIDNDWAHLEIAVLDAAVAALARCIVYPRPI